ncbi:MAG: prephenate dehydratase [Coriobacteriia bacterium]|nr:prephenate dehydratase [Coriobacteriia bacterium]
MRKFAFLGPRGTFSDEAARLFADATDEATASSDFLECATIPEVFEAVRSGAADFGTVPIENSLEGSVTITLDELALGSQVVILDEAVLDIHHCLVAAPGARKADIGTVISHPQALGQCAQWILRTLPGRPVIARNSTAEAVRQAQEHPGYAAIASAFAAELYGAEILERNIEDRPNNQTNFVLIAGEERAAEHRAAQGESGGQGQSERPYKTSIALFMWANKPGALLMILAEFAYAGINLTKIESRPTKEAMGEYMFFLDFEGRADDPDVVIALDSLRLKLREVKVLGTYRAA